ncbi:beta/gamma crystallin-related protein [Massilia endophytica]|uniref:beta/gamma crystallin-related protein n=1 Tax=Massilia endophytica TaxID=2899220 RepID=UPI001E28D400|nr:beta/gamma crystallin-related protein [Massilia endophytica]UGQ47527.1 beta/gamma crystallin family protein [Massilia endophytica]
MENLKMKYLIAAAFLSTCALAASAGELALYSQQGFRGSEMVLQGGAANFRDIGFNDRASSMVVRSGTWEVCEHRDFGGYCAIFERGEYPVLERFNNSISSAREVPGRHRRHWRDRDRDGYDDRFEGRNEGRYEERRGYGWQQREEPVILFSGTRFEGERVMLHNDLRTLRDAGFNDRAGSLVINEGQWEFCEHADYRGQCVVLGPGRYARLDELNNRISSLRRVR